MQPTQQEINLTAYKSGKTPEEIQRLLQGTQSSTTSPVPGSVSSILGEGFGAEDPFITQYTQDQLNQYNQVIDETAIRKQKESELQAQIDAINAVYADRLRQEQTKGQGRLGSGRALQARSGLIGSDFGTAQTENISQLNREQEQSVENERLALVNQLLAGARESAASEISAKRAAKEAGGKAYLDYLAGASTRKAEKVSKAAQLLLSLGKSPQDISDEELKQAGISRQDLTMEYTGMKSAQDAAATTAELDQAKKIAEIEKLNADIAKGQLDASKYYEVGNRIYEQGTNRYIGDSAFNPYTGAMQVTPGNSVYDPVKGTFVQAPITGGATGDLRGYRSQYPNEAWSGTNNPGGITVNPTFTQTLKNAGIQVESSSPRPASEGGSYYVFPTIEEGMKAYNLLWQSPSYQNLTVGQALARWGTDSLPGVPTNKIVSQLTPEEFQNLQMAQIKKESPGLYKVLTSGAGGGQTGGYNPDLSTAYQNYNTGKLSPTELTMLTKQTGGIEEFARQAKEYGREIAVTQALPQLENYKKDLQWLKDNYSNLGKAGAFFNVGDFDAILRNVTNKTAFQELTRLKEMGATFGALSEKEFANIGSSTEIGKLKPTAGKETWTNALDRLIKEVETAQNKITGGTQPPTTPAAGTQTGNTLQSTTGKTIILPN